jgi:LacI family transcriptional regulator
VAAKEGRATLATVAASAGVSVATVSKVLNGRNDVAPATRALVQNILRQHDYVGRRAEPISRGAGVARPTIELVFHGRLNTYSTEIIQGVLDAGEEAAVSVAVTLRSREQRTGGTVPPRGSVAAPPRVFRP